MTYYCNQSCQRAHWPLHKEECKKIVKREAQIASLGESMRGSISANKVKFLNILMTTYARYRYIKDGGTDAEILDQFDKAILSRKNDEEHYELDLIRPIMAKYATPSSRDEYLQIRQIIEEFDQGKRTFNDPHFFSKK
jgi:hypothetical protein